MYDPRYEALTYQVAATRLADRPDLRDAFVRMMRQESHFDADIVEGRVDSPVGARGIAQLMPIHWPFVDPLDPEAALIYAAGELRRLADWYGDIPAAVAAYNWGEGRVNAAREQAGANWRALLPAETREYLQIVLGDTMKIPIEGPVTQGFGPSDEPLEPPRGDVPHFHGGIDFGAPAGTPIYATTPGTVVWAGPRNRQGAPVLDDTGYGNCVMVQDARGYIHIYGHMQEVRVAMKAVVARGDALGLVGSTGASTGSHLHYEVRPSLQEPSVDPAPWLAEPAARGPRLRVSASDGLRLRTEPSNTSTVIDTLPEHTQVYLRLDGWLPVITEDGTEGYMWAEYLAADAGSDAVIPPAYTKFVADIRQIVANAEAALGKL